MKAHGREFCKEGESCDNKNAVASEQNGVKQVQQQPQSPLQKHIYSVLKNENFNVNDFFGKEGDPVKEAEKALSTAVDEPKKQNSVYSYATDKSSPVLSRPTTANFYSPTQAPKRVKESNFDLANTNLYAAPAHKPATSTVYLKWPRTVNHLTTMPQTKQFSTVMMTPSTTTTTPRPRPTHQKQKSGRFGDDEHRDFEVMLNAAKDNLYGRRGAAKRQRRPFLSNSPPKQNIEDDDMKTIWQSPVRTIYARPMNVWAPVHRHIYPVVRESPSNVFQSPSHSSVEYNPPLRRQPLLLSSSPSMLSSANYERNRQLQNTENRNAAYRGHQNVHSMGNVIGFHPLFYNSQRLRPRTPNPYSS